MENDDFLNGAHRRGQPNHHPLTATKEIERFGPKLRARLEPLGFTCQQFGVNFMCVRDGQTISLLRTQVHLDHRVIVSVDGGNEYRLDSDGWRKIEDGGRESDSPLLTDDELLEELE